MRPEKNEATQINSPFKKLRLDAELTQEELAGEIGVSQSTIRRWEKLNCEPTMTVRQMRNLCKAVGKRFDQLPDPLGNNQTEQRRETILGYLRSHPGEQNTINLLSAKLNLTRQQTRNAIEHLEFKGLISRHAVKIPNKYGVEYTNFVYKALPKHC